MASGLWGLKLVALVLGLLVMVPETMQLTVKHPLYGVVQKINSAGPYLGLVLSGSRDEKLLEESGYFVPSETTPVITIAGRKFHVGYFNGVNVIYVNAGSPLANVGVTVQLLLDNFRIFGLVNYGGSATVDNKVFLADVVVPANVGYSAVWDWQVPNQVLVFPALRFGDYNVPEVGENKLGSVHFQDAKKYTPSNSNKKSFWFYVHPEWLELASTITSIKSTEGRLGASHVVHGVNVASSDVYIQNKAYASFLNKRVNATIVDTESAAVVTTAIANDVPHIVFRGATNRVGSSSDERLKQLAAKNVLNVVAQFIEFFKPQPRVKATTSPYKARPSSYDITEVY